MIFNYFLSNGPLFDFSYYWRIILYVSLFLSKTLYLAKCCVVSKKNHNYVSDENLNG